MTFRRRCGHRAQHNDYILRQLETFVTANQDALNAAAATLNAAADRLAAALVPEAPDDLTELNAAVARVDGLVPAPVVAPVDPTVSIVDALGNLIPAV